ncbi:histidinol-phosphate aminotransferase [Inquilinus ginsengisoli]|uniref:Histidinol-phosphate aminotransferase n=1 Tax=Inquilinus ginsengisoli TaxID=363840 RepID=A0ABU1K031_9PROT|nr:histidinol-phosphate transaminase [Inquilinus ginsengisoli]MDR6294232.1 histidinol-phosphate aminotransferase [Inquilinus ginsengisoli]
MTTIQAPRPRPGLLDIDPYIGGEANAVPHPRLGRTIRLASNEGAFGPSPQATAAYRELGGEIHRYPDGGACALREALAARFGLDAGRIVAGAGSDELIALLAKSYAGPGDEVLYSRHGFLMYPIAAKAVGATPVAAPEAQLHTDVDALLARVTPRTRIVFLANPNNPTGYLLPRAEVERLHAALPSDVILALDAAYAEYIDDPDYSAGADLVDRAGNVVMLRTFSKIYGMGALRLGWAYASAGITDILHRARGPFNVSAAAQAAGVAALADRDFVAKSVAHNAEWRRWTAAELAKLGLAPLPSAGNFLLVDFGDRDAEAARQHLKGTGILVRQMGGYGLPSCLRITIGTEDEMRAVVEALAEHLRGR